MPDDVRWMTRACAKDFVGAANAEAAFRHPDYKRLFEQYERQTPSTWFTTEGGSDAGIRIRTAGLGKGRPRPGPRQIGQVKIQTPAQRAWVWEDDWSIIGEDLGQSYYWLIAVGKRVKDSPHQDLQEIGKPLLHDPSDSWRPTEGEYAELLGHLSEEQRLTNIEAIHAARDEAHENPNEVIAVDLTDHAAEIAEALVEDVHQGVVVEAFAVRYFILGLRFEDGSPIPNAELEDLASFAFDDLPEDVEWGVSLDEATYIEELVIDPTKVICYAADLPD